MSFKWLNKQGVESSEGFILQSVDRYHYHYSEGDREMSITVEPGYHAGVKKYHEVIFLDETCRWQPPHDGEHLTAEKLAHIKRNISEALLFMDISCEFQGI